MKELLAIAVDVLVHGVAVVTFRMESEAISKGGPLDAK